MNLVLKKAKRIAEGQEVIYTVRGKPMKFKKINGKMKYIGPVDEPKKKIALKKEPEKKAVVKQLTPEQKRVYEETGIKCMDDNALQYVDQQMKSFFLEESSQITDISKLPAYIRNITFMSSNIAKFTVNKVWNNWENIVWQEKYLEVDMFKDMPDELKSIMDQIKSVKKYDPETLDRIKDITGMIKSFERRMQIASSSAAETMNNSYYKEEGVYPGWKDKEKLMIYSSEDYLEVEEKVNRLERILNGSSTWEQEGFTRDYTKYISKTELEGIVENMNAALEYHEKIREQEAILEGVTGTVDFDEGGKIEKTRKDVIKKMKRLSKTNKKVEAFLRGLYVAQFLNKTLITRGAAAGYKSMSEKIGEKGPDKFINASEASVVMTNDQARALFIKKRVKTMKQESAIKKLRSALSDEGDEKKSFSLKTCSKQILDTIKKKIKETYDKNNHGGFGVKIHNAFQIDDTEYYKDFKELEKKIDNVVFSYHGTTFDAAAKIARGGFKITRPKTGRMIGDGIYGAKNSSKSLQYAGGYNRTPGSRGVLFVCKNSLGEVKILTEQDFRKGRMTGTVRDYCNKIMDNSNVDTVYAKKNTGGLLNDEWVCKNPMQMIPIYWIDVEITTRNNKDNLVG